MSNETARRRLCNSVRALIDYESLMRELVTEVSWQAPNLALVRAPMATHIAYW